MTNAQAEALKLIFFDRTLCDPVPIIGWLEYLIYLESC